MSTRSTTHALVSPAACDPATRVTRSLLGYGIVAGPFYLAIALVQALLRPGFDLTRHDVSLLSNGDLGWIQIANFVVTGAMVVACAAGLRRALRSGRGAHWAPRLVGIYGLGLIAAGVFVADPMNGFPAGAPAGMPSAITTHGLLHILSAAVGFFALVGACAIMGARYQGEGRRRFAAFSWATGAIFLAAFGAIASGSATPAIVIGFWVALIIAWSWLAAVARDQYRSAAIG